MPTKDPKTNSAPDTAMELAEKLKASLTSSADRPVAPTVPAEEDDLAVLLRAQLAHAQSDTKPALTLELDTEGFEEEEPAAKEEATEAKPAAAEPVMVEPIKEETTEAEPAMVEPIKEETTEAEPAMVESIEEETTKVKSAAAEPVQEETTEAEPTMVESIEEETTKVKSAAAEPVQEETIEAEPVREETAKAEPVMVESIQEETAEVKSAVAEPVQEEATEAKPAAVDPVQEETTAAEPAREETAKAEPVTVESIKEETTEVKSAAAEPVQEETTVAEPVAETPVPAAFRVPTNAVTDDRLNGLPRGDTVGGIRLRVLDEANTRLLDEMGTAPAVMPTEEKETVAEPSAEGTEPAPAPETAAAGKDGAIRGHHDPMQLGPDAIVAARSTAMESEDTATFDTGTYTDRMLAKGTGEQKDRDTELYVHLGFESRLRRADEQAGVEREHDRALHRETMPRGDRPAAYAGREYRGRKQTDSTENAYRRAESRGFARMLTAFAGALFGIIYSLLPLMGSEGPVGTRIYPIVGVAWLVLCSLPFVTRIGVGLRSLFDFEPARYATASLALAVAAVHDVFSCVTATPRLFGGIALFMLAVAALAEYAAAVAEHHAFTVVSAGKPVHTLTADTTPAASVCEGTDATPARVLSAVRGERLSDYFARTARYNPYAGRLNYLLPAALVCAIVAGGLAVLLGGSLTDEGIRAFTAVYLTCLPAAYVAALHLPMAKANTRLARKGAALVGSAAVSEYASREGDRVVLRDGDALGAVQVKEIILRDDPDAAHWRKQASRLFRLLHSPMAVEPGLREDDLSGLHAEIAESGEGYIRLYMIHREKGESVEVIAGSHEALTAHGIRLPKITMERRYKKTPESHVLYIAFDRKFRLAYAAEYHMDRGFVRAARRLASLGYRVTVETYDPMVRQDMLSRSRAHGLPPITLVRPPYLETARKARSSGVVVTGKSTDLCYPLAACHGAKKLWRRAHVLSWIGLAVGFAASMIAITLGQVPLLATATVAAWQLLWVLLLSVLGLKGGGVDFRESESLPTHPASAPNADPDSTATPSQKPSNKKDKDTSTT